ncbi:hypothetical protein FB567DRAFT_614222 [Paraphoma chrysanthemicola]|uniref:non-specific serine/threonine protein kinase n=1 Tax=Paraphoma chrysanthemicola TaxID=798071 RepID=A0A8K0RGH9_9PLEO|nr:hypothetical protein FB567DRAFT_614222 [Paraphoma chrysanthemicola]
MSPPFRRIYDYFRHDAAIYMQEHREAWTKQQRSNTISTIWAGHPTIQEHYADCENQDPGPQLPEPHPIPDRPYTAKDTARAKKVGRLPDRGQGEQVAQADEPEADAEPVDARGDEEPEAPQGEAQAQNEAQDDPGADDGLRDDAHAAENNVLAPSSANVDKMPDDFLPLQQDPAWNNDPVLPALQKGADGKMVKNFALLQTKPHISAENEDMWHGVKILGTGGFGVAGLWVEVDDNANIKRKMVIKDTQIADRRDWRDPKIWRGRVPQEIRCHQLIEQRREAEPEACHYLIRFLGYRLMMVQMRYRIYLEHYEAGDLYHAMDDHDKECTAEFLPEAFIWYVMNALATSCLVLHKGTVADEPLEGWKPITHLDVTPTNVLLSFKKRKRENALVDGVGDWETLPILPVLADFGVAFYSLGDGPCPISDNTEDYLIRREVTRYAPEHQNQEGPPWTPLGEKTDVWGIGSILWALITHRNLNSGPVREDRRDRDKNDIPISTRLEDGRNELKLTADVTLSGKRFAASNEYTS